MSVSCPNCGSAVDPRNPFCRLCNIRVPVPSQATHVLEIDNPLKPLSRREGIDIASSDERPASFWYDAGVDFIRRKDWKAAHGAFAKAVGINPGYKDAKKLLKKSAQKAGMK